MTRKLPKIKVPMKSKGPSTNCKERLLKCIIKCIEAIGKSNIEEETKQEVLRILSLVFRYC